MPLKGYKQTEDHKIKMRKNRKGKGLGNKNSIGQIPWNKDKKHSKETRQKISLAQKGKKYSKETRKKMSESHKGEKHYNWQGGLSRNKQGTPEYKQWRSSVFQRDNWTCQTCGIRSSEGRQVYLEPHHIKSWAKYSELRYELENGITLCKDCHKLTDNYKGKNK